MSPVPLKTEARKEMSHIGKCYPEHTESGRQELKGSMADKKASILMCNVKRLYVSQRQCGHERYQVVTPSLCLVSLALDLFCASSYCADLYYYQVRLLTQDGPLPGESRFYD